MILLNVRNVPVEPLHITKNLFCPLTGTEQLERYCMTVELSNIQVRNSRLRSCNTRIVSRQPANDSPGFSLLASLPMTKGYPDDACIDCIIRAIEIYPANARTKEQK
ncbi:MAG TPA: hypothetical protein DCY14_14995 [Anaerolineae bacterium]|nr:hypothetical protein [Anaerolineae bacterium]